MFGKLKEKLKSWAKKVSQEAEKKEEKIEESPEDKTEEKLEEAKKEIEIPMEFSVAKQKYKPNLEKLEKIQKALEEAKESLEEKKHALDAKELKIAKGEPLDKEKPKEEKEKPGEKSFFKKAISKISKIKITEKEFEIYEEELQMLLLENNVALEVAEKIIRRLKEEMIGKELLKKEIETEIQDFFKKIIREILIDPFDIVKAVKEKKDKPYVILFCGINGTGKTTTIAKIANSLKKQGLSCVLAAADTFRAASIEQIQKHGDKLGFKVISHEYGSDPAAVGFDAIKYAKKNNIDCVLIDTAGRMHTEKNLLKEIEKISKVNNPDIKIFVGEAITGNDSIEQIKSFDWAIGISGIILTKADTDEKGGTALSVGYVTKKPILYLGIGQEYDNIIPFNKEKFIEELGL